MINCMKFWLKESDIDGFDAMWLARCQMISGRSVFELKKGKNIFMLAEGNKTNSSTKTASTRLLLG